MLKKFCMIFMTALILCVGTSSLIRSQEPTEKVNIERECADCFIRFPRVEAERDSVLVIKDKESRKKSLWRVVALVEGIVVVVLFIKL